jgi:hypothetical protein
VKQRFFYNQASLKGHFGKGMKSLSSHLMSQRLTLNIEIVQTWFLRSLALVWMLKGFIAWGLMLGVDAPYQGVFEASALSLQIAIVFFAISHLIAAIGLWLLSSWGRAMWILTVLAETALSVFFPKIVGANLFILVSNLFLMTTYSFLMIYNVQMKKSGAQLTHNQAPYAP